MRELKQLPERVLPCIKHDKTPKWFEFLYFPFQLQPGWYDYEDLEEVREWLFKKGYVAKVSLNHKAEVRKVSCVLPSGRLVVVKTPDRMTDIAALSSHFGLIYRMGGLPATIGNCI